MHPTRRPQRPSRAKLGGGGGAGRKPAGIRAYGRCMLGEGLNACGDAAVRRRPAWAMAGEIVARLGN
jgi:hypothetical protein